MRSRADVDFTVHWHAFQLNSQLPGGNGINKMQMYQAKFGKDRCEQMLPRMIATGREHGINFSYGGNIGNTFDSHRLVSLAAKQGKEDEFMEEIFHNYFEEEKCLSDHGVLLAAASKVGLQGAEELLAGSGEEKEVLADMRKYQQGLRISGVPYFLFNQKHGESGALPADELQNIFRKVLRE